MSKTQFIATTIPYVNAQPHVGFALELVQADSYARYRRLSFQNLFFQSGTDENSLKNALAAKKRGVSVENHVAEHAELYKRLLTRLNISVDEFVQTSSDRHRQFVQSFWRKLNSNDIYRKIYAGHYCIGCEDFLKDSELVNGQCPDHLSKPELIEEENFFFRLSRYQQQLTDLIESDTLQISPAFRKREILSFIERGLTDISVSRGRERCANWGILVPDDSEQIIYVWIDALINYLTGCSSEEEAAVEIWNSFSEKVHFIGKNVWKFHAVYWPALLLSAGISLPQKIFIHGFLTVDGKKISKSHGALIDPNDVIDKTSVDTLRYYLLRCCSPFEDADFSLSAVKNAHNSYLVNGLGNLVGRLKTLANRATLDLSDIPKDLTSFASVDDAIEVFRFDEALKCLWREIDRINAEIAGERPWEKLEDDETRRKIGGWFSDLLRIIHWLKPFLPDASARAEQLLGCEELKPLHLFERLK